MPACRCPMVRCEMPGASLSRCCWQERDRDASRPTNACHTQESICLDTSSPNKNVSNLRKSLWSINLPGGNLHKVVILKYKNSKFSLDINHQFVAQPKSELELSFVMDLLMPVRLSPMNRLQINL